jgi:site-specific DNA recombinase
MEPQRRAIGLTRVSVEGTRETIHSYATQAERIEQDCEREGAQLLYIGQERNVSGGADLSNRPELLRAVEAVEAGQADIIVAAYFDRFFRSLEVQGEVIRRIEAAGGEVLTLDHGKLTNGTPAERLQANVVGAMAQFFREQTAEKSADGQAKAVADGKVMWSRVPLGYRREGGKLYPDDATVPLVREAFNMRLAGQSYADIRRWLADHGVTRSLRGVQVMLGLRAYIGEVRFGQHINTEAHDPIIDRDVWNAVQRMVIPRGPRPKSERLLARLGVLRCGNCGSPLRAQRMVKQGDYYMYRCHAEKECERRVTINARDAEAAVVQAVRNALSDAEGRASAAANAEEVRHARDRAQEALDAALRTFATAGLDSEPAAVERLAELRQQRDEAQEAVDRLGGSETYRLVNAATAWDEMTMHEQRALIRATVSKAVVAPGRRPWAPEDAGAPRGMDRVTVHLIGQ